MNRNAKMIQTRKIAIVIFAAFWSFHAPLYQMTAQENPVTLQDSSQEKFSETIPETPGRKTVEEPVAVWNFQNLAFTGNDIARLPNGGHTFSLLESWYSGAILSNPDTGGFSLVEPHDISLHGESNRWQRYRYNNHDLSDPGHPGRPFIDLPVRFWNTFSIHSPLSLYLHEQGYQWNFHPLNDGRTFLALANPGHLGGDSWIPVGFSDREPSTAWGASPERRKFGPSVEGSAGYAFSGIGGNPAMAMYELDRHTRTFMKLSGYEEAYRQTFLYSQSLPSGQFDFMYQGSERDQAGIETSQDPSLALAGGYHALFAGYEAANQDHELSLNLGYRFDRYLQKKDSPMVWDLYDEILYRNPHRPYEQTATFFGARYQKNNLASFSQGAINGIIYTRIERVAAKSLYQDNLLARTYLGSPADMTVFENSAPYAHDMVRLSPTGEYIAGISGGSMQIRGGVQYEGFLPESPESKKNRFGLLAPVASVRLEKNLGKWNLYTGAQSDAIPLTNDVAVFANASAPTGTRYFWNDDGDLIPEANETGGLINRTGGAFHRVDENLKPARRNEIYLGTGKPIANLWSIAFSAHLKHFQNLYTIVYDPEMGYANGGYSRVNRPDTREGYAYNRDPAAAGHELYLLTNRTEPGLYANLELQILKMESVSSHWFVNFIAGAYYGQAETIIGNGPDYNDMGRISESSADPNKQINQLARIDFDRSYVGHVIAGWRPFDGFVWSNLIRYRDGEPFGQMMALEGLSQGPVIVQNQNRSEPPDGMPRFTYYFCWDMRFSYHKPVSGGRLESFFDIYNLIDSRSELYEYSIAGEQFRDSVETRGGRTYRAMISYYWE